jgi:hypothetical protein
MPPIRYSDNLKVKDALQLYFSQYHFKDGGYKLKWFKIKLGPVFIPLPNIKARVSAVKIHDIHHLVTEYEANYKGEAEIGAWEIASGCEKYSVAWMLNLGSFFIGVLFYPRHLLAAFLRGRRCSTNLYYETQYDEALLNKTVGELRNKIEPVSSGNNSYKDYLLFMWWCLIAITYHAAVLFCFFYLVYKGGSYLF